MTAAADCAATGPTQPLAAAAVVCAACRAERAVPWLTKNGYPVIRCVDCGFAWVHPTPKPAEIAAIYAGDYWQASADFGYRDSGASLARQHRRHARTRRATLRRLGYCGRRALDWGCGSGWWLEHLRADHDVRFGIEPGRRAAASPAPCSAPIVADAADLPPALQFDLITLFDVLEHLPDVEATLREVQRRLAPSGWLMIVVPTTDHWTARHLPQQWDQVKPPEHLSYFNERSLCRLVRAHGLRAVHVESAWLRWPRPLPHFPRACQWPLRWPVRWLARCWPWLHRGISDSLLLVARAP